MKKIAILASGSGSNAEKILEYLKDSTKAHVTVIGSNKKDAFVLERAKKFNVPTFTFTRSDLESGLLTEKLLSLDIDLVVLAGFLLKIPKDFIRAFPEKIVNIHPALLPKYGGKGMYGMHVHEAVKAAGEKETGITIHLVNENYDEGKVIFQAGVGVLETDSAEDIANKVHELEHKYFPNVIESLL
ncbi:phosphoribosylglycinamide formyltransferase [Belliella aquatica]|uniref:Phosphoribosylglycinamide formyltransferase n=1 Tax=Belliella aquatica TaxID=1323734 RepID=A0ABQ1N5G1_9BACT|nr:phosphoribosylglycinamide formyltransferase [Belliella aquatica]MCH7407598.1 phosphoribosylglycinamide formyltransferase [Belliella aquatica]GGC54465.1 phosphoribosylglycinamide formyltransferase [Belliella aquatica]